MDVAVYFEYQQTFGITNIARNKNKGGEDDFCRILLSNGIHSCDALKHLVMQK